MSVDDTLGRLVVLMVIGLCLGSTVMAAETQNSSPEITVTDVQVGVGETVTAKIRLSSVPNGLAGYDITVTVGDSVEIVNASLNEKLRLTRTKITDDGERVVLRGVDIETKIESGAGPVTLATVTLRGESSGEASIEVSVGAIDDDSGSAINPTIENATMNVEKTNDATPQTDSTTNTTAQTTPTSTDETPQATPNSTDETSKTTPTSTDETSKASPISPNTTNTGTPSGGSGTDGGMTIVPAVVVMVIIALLTLVGLLWVVR
jgi:hypothetical protein